MIGYMTYGDDGASQILLILAGSLLVLAIYAAIIESQKSTEGV